MDFDDAASWLRQQGVHIVTLALGFPGTGRGDGTGEDAEGQQAPANVVRQLRQAGILVVTAAGNEGDKHLGGRLLGSDGDGWQYLNGNAQGQGFSVGAGGTVTVELKRDAWPGPPWTSTCT
ncbi:S8 family serine peptidase [Crossiella sp. NPDC003009]